MLVLIALVSTAAVATGGCSAGEEAELPGPGSSTSETAVSTTAPSFSTSNQPSSAAGLSTSVDESASSQAIEAAGTEHGEVPVPDKAGVPEEVERPISFTVLYDNVATRPDTREDWGFSCLVEGLEKTVLFDTGADTGILLANMEALQVEPARIDVVVLSHDHSDHTGGLAGIVRANPGAVVYHPASFSERSLAAAREAGASTVPIEAAVPICPGVWVTEPIDPPGGDLAESGLLVETVEGPVLLTGCAHPGLLEMAGAAAELTGGRLYSVLGGFHLGSHKAAEVDSLVRGLQSLGVQCCGPAHCTGEAATSQLEAAFGNGFLKMGVGTVISF